MSEPRSAPAATSGLRSADNVLMLASVALALVACGWFAANVDHARGPLVLLWVSAPLSAVIPAALCWRAARSTRLPAPTRRFWRHLGVAAALVGLGAMSQIYDALGGSEVPSPRIGPVTLAVHSAAIVVIMWALYRLPLHAPTRSERIKVGLDASTVMLATVVFVWHFQTRELLLSGKGGPTSLLASAIVIALTLVATFAVAKVMLSSYTFIDRHSLWILAGGLLLGSLGNLPERLITDKPHLMVAQALIPTVLSTTAWAAYQQLRAAECPGRVAVNGRRRRPFSIWPYIAVVVVDGLLLATTWRADGGDDDQRTVAIAAVVLTGLVVLRQLTAFQENRGLLAKLDHGATHDALTQLANRELFNQRLQAALMSLENGERVIVALIDLDDFKVVNDTYGHGVGDGLLIDVAGRLTASVRVGDTVARLGGDEFVVILNNLDHADPAVERVLGALRPPIYVEQLKLRIRASIGVAAGRPGDDPNELLRQADIAMYAAKFRGGGAYVHYTPGMDHTMPRQGSLVTDLRHAVEHAGLSLVYQPIVTMPDSRLAGVEALVRWSHPDRGMIPPTEFIPLAERTGLIVPLGRWVLREACRQAATWTVQHGESAPAVSVNISAHQLSESDFVDDVVAALGDSGLPPQRLTLEITETTAVNHDGSELGLHALRRLGLRIALDDFGTGQSTLSLLHSCPVDELKLDQSFTQATPVSGGTRMAAAVHHLASALELAVVAEGVETAQQAAALHELGYTAAQGFYYAKPVCADRIGELISSRDAFGPNRTVGVRVE